MRRHVLLITTTAAILTCVAVAASAQAPVAQAPAIQQNSTTHRFRAVR
jgi:hypothetical protein